MHDVIWAVPKVRNNPFVTPIEIVILIKPSIPFVAFYFLQGASALTYFRGYLILNAMEIYWRFRFISGLELLPIYSQPARIDILT